MKKFILGSAFAAALVLGAAYSYNNSNAGLSDLQMLNANVLAQAENDLCPNGCHDGGKGCYCNGWYPTYLEHNWGN